MNINNKKNQCLIKFGLNLALFQHLFPAFLHRLLNSIHVSHLYQIVNFYMKQTTLAYTKATVILIELIFYELCSVPCRL